MAGYKETLRRLALNDETFVAAVLGMGRDTVEDSTLDEKTHALARLSASLAIDAAPAPTSQTSTWRWPPARRSTRSSGA